MKIIVLGKEQDIDMVYQCLQNNCRIDTTVIWNEEYGPEILEQSILKEFDCIVIAVKEEKYAGYLYDLISTVIEDDSKIVDFYAIYSVMIPKMKLERIMKNPMIRSYDGMILGISHAEYGILPRFMNGSFCNLAVASQDIYYNLKTFEYCITNYPQKICNMKYLILDMFDYTYFNYDVSLSKTAVSYYYYYGGFSQDAHNFDKNKNFQYNFSKLKAILDDKGLEHVSHDKLLLWEKIFGNVHEKNRYREFGDGINYLERARVIKNKDVEEYQVNTSIVKNVYTETIKENISHFYQLLELAYSFNQDLKVVLVLLPRYEKVEVMGKEAYSRWKEMFYEIIEEAGKIYPFHFLDFKGHDISKQKECYYDISHLNYYGAMKFTKLLNGYLELL